MSRNYPNISIIGAGLAGLTLAVSLAHHGHPISNIKVFESHSSSTSAVGGAIMLSPNALGIFESLGFYEELKQHGYAFEVMRFVDGDGNQRGTYEFGSEKKYGYKGLRVYRTVILNQLVKRVELLGIEVVYNAKYVDIVSKPTDKKVVFKLADGTQHETDILVGTDGIHSRVRSHVAPEAIPKYLGLCSVASSVRTNKLRFPQTDYQLPVSIQDKPGAFIVAPQNADASECFAGRQLSRPDQGREGWSKMLAEPEKILELVREDKNEFSDLARSALEGLEPEHLNVWAFHRVPRIDDWSADHGKVVVLGDAAHAVPPTTGQGANQAAEDVWGFSLLLQAAVQRKEVVGSPWWVKAFNWWQGQRQVRMEKLFELTEKVNNSRLPHEEQAKLPEASVWSSEHTEDLQWLFQPDIEHSIKQWVESHQ